MKGFAHFRRALRRFAPDERGTQMVELAIVMPVLCLLLATTAEFGRFFQTYTTLTKATRSGARFLTTAAANGDDDGKAKNLVVYGNTEGEGNPVVSGLTTDNVTITREGGSLSAGMPEKVTVEIDDFNYQPLFNPGAFINNDAASLNIEVGPKTTMRCMPTIPSS